MRRTVLLLLGAILGGCAQPVLQPLPAVERDAVVDVFRPWAFYAGGVAMTLAIDGVPHVRLDTRQRVRLRLAPGSRHLAPFARGGWSVPLTLSLATGQRRCVKAVADLSAKPVEGPGTGYFFLLEEFPCASLETLGSFEEIPPGPG